MRGIVSAKTWKIAVGNILPNCCKISTPVFKYQRYSHSSKLLNEVYNVATIFSQHSPVYYIVVKSSCLGYYNNNHTYVLCCSDENPARSEMCLLWLRDLFRVSDGVNLYITARVLFNMALHSDPLNVFTVLICYLLVSTYIQVGNA